MRRRPLFHVSTSTLQIMDAGKCPHVTPRSAAAKERMDQLVVVCNLLLLAMMKIIQVFPNRPKKVKKTNRQSSQYPSSARCEAEFGIDNENLPTSLER